jgi:3D (Asp-Asp-Asp) domain-containing protein
LIKTSVKFSVLSILLFVLINVFYIQPDAQAYPYNKSDALQVEVTPVPVTEEAILTPAVEIPISDASTVAVNTTSAAVPTLPTAVEAGKTEALIKTEALVTMGAFRATAYCLRGRTASGGGVRRGIVAADPRVLPLGSRIQVNAGAYSGTYVVADTGGAIRGRILDIWVPSCAEANRFGRRTISVSRVGQSSKKAK